MKRTLLYYIFLSIFSTFIYAESIEKYNVDLKLHQSGSLELQESIKYDFGNNKRRGIYRDIPYKIKLQGLHQRDIGINGVKVLRDNGHDKFKLINQDSKTLRIRIGDPNVYLNGKHLYDIFYRVDMGVLSKDNQHDITSWNIIGNQWGVSIKEVVAFIQLPPSLSRKNTKITVYTGARGLTTNKAKTQWIDEHTYRIQVNYLMANEGVTADIIYPINILDQSGQANSELSTKDQISASWNWFAIIILSLISYRFWIGFGANDFKRIVSTHYQPPKGLSILQSGLIYDKFANKEDFSAAIIELAQKGYLTIKKNDKSSMPVFFKTDKKDLTELTPEMRYLLNDLLFDRQDTLKLKDNSNAQARKLSNGLDKINDMLYEWSANQSYMQTNPKEARKKFLIQTILLAIPLLGVSIFTSYRLLGAEPTFVSMFYSIFLSAGLIVGFSVRGWFGTLFATMFIGISSLAMVPFFTQELSNMTHIFYTPLFLIVVFLFVIWYTYKRIGKYTQRGSVAKSQLDGLRRFIRRVKSDEIRRNLKRDPHYLERYLAYAILFDEAKHWLKFYEELNIPQPDWYHGHFYSIYYLNSDMQSASTVQESSSSGYSSGGGGFSGGGMGGGGGGSW